MKMKCENIITCGNYNCELNCEGACIRTVVALDGDGKCVMCKSKPKPKYEGITVHYKKADGGNPVEDVPTPLSKLVPPLD